MMNPLFTATLVDDRRSAHHATADHHRLVSRLGRSRRWVGSFVAADRKKTCLLYEAATPTAPAAAAVVGTASPA